MELLTKILSYLPFSSFLSLFSGGTPKKLQFSLSPVEKHELEAMHLVQFKSFNPTDQFALNLYPARLWSPSSLRPPPPGTQVWPIPDAVLRDRAKRQAAWHATVFEDEIANGARWVKAMVGEEIVGMAGWYGPRENAVEWDVTEELKEVVDLDFLGSFEKEHKEVMDRSFDDPKNVWYLMNLYVLPAYQGQGIGTALLQEQLQHNEACFVESSDNAESFYRAHGFRKVGWVSGKGWLDGVVREGEKDEISLPAMAWGVE